MGKELTMLKKEQEDAVDNPGAATDASGVGEPDTADITPPDPDLPITREADSGATEDMPPPDPDLPLIKAPDSVPIKK